MRERSRRATEGPPLDPAKFRHPKVTADGSPRAHVELEALETLWFNTGTRCNIECRNCYIESSPSNDRLADLTATEVAAYLDEVARLGWRTRRIGFTGGEPFINHDFPEMLADSLERGFEALVLTNAMQPMMRPSVRRELQRLRSEHGARLHLRVSLDHYTPELHESERGPRSWNTTLAGLRWLAREDFGLSVAARTRWGEAEERERAGFARLFAAEGLPLDAHDPSQLVLFPEMDPSLDVPEITTSCWGILGVEPSAMMCAASRMVVKRRGAARPVVLACTLLPYDPGFELGPTLAGAAGPVALNHPHCARFCVLGGGSCSAYDAPSAGN